MPCMSSVPVQTLLYFGTNASKLILLSCNSSASLAALDGPNAVHLVHATQRILCMQAF